MATMRSGASRVFASLRSVIRAPRRNLPCFRAPLARSPRRSGLLGLGSVSRRRYSGRRSRRLFSDSAGAEEEAPEAPVWMQTVSAMLYGALALTVYKAYRFAVDEPPATAMILAEAERNSEIKERVGSPLKLSFMWSGNSDKGQLVADLPVTGPKGKATLRVRAVNIPNEGWRILMLDAIVGSEWGRPIPILDPAVPSEMVESDDDDSTGVAVEPSSPEPEQSPVSAETAVAKVDSVDMGLIDAFLVGYAAGGPENAALIESNGDVGFERSFIIGYLRGGDGKAQPRP